MGLVEDGGLEHARFVRLEPAAHHGDEFGLVHKTCRSAVNGQEAVAAFDVLIERRELLWRDVVVICVQHHRIVMSQRVLIQRRLGLGEVIEIDRIAAHGIGEDRHIGGAVVMLALVTEKEHPNRTRVR